ncbi:unnamed protein product [Didymodactylos carnosus]|uniref:Uncharacterized protein n=1 Tax=Didymodactylos carnosus TaxID=1234261 RepID=A0A8S2D3W0_9BILA|nr:unnamed protein product [Didymodactylos carnosus]CAF3657501.1 unnamed protein product [Didymodactylos carnosus]
MKENVRPANRENIYWKMTHILNCDAILADVKSNGDPTTCDKYYAIKPYSDASVFPHYGNISLFDTETKFFLPIANFTFDVNDTSDLYYFVAGPVAVNIDDSIIYMPVECATSFQRLLLLSYNMKTGKYYQSKWILSSGVFHFLFYDPIRRRLFGLRDVSTFTFYMEEYDLKTLDVVKVYTQQDGEKYAFQNRHK